MKKILFIFTVLLFGFVSCQNGHEKKTNEPVPVKTAVVAARKASIPLRTSGKVASKTEVKLSFKTGGIISQIYVDEGENIRKGQTLARLDLDEIQAHKKQAELSLEKTKRDFDRVQNLYFDSVATLEQLQNAETALELAQSQLKIANFNLRHSTIIAPSQGRVLKRLAEPNELIAAGHPVFLVALTDRNWVMRVNVADKDIVKLAIGDSAQLCFDAYPDKTFAARISETGKFADPYTGTYEVELIIHKSDLMLASGFIGKANIYPSKQYEFKLVPVEALVKGTENTGYVYKIENGKPRKRQIEIQKIGNRNILVKKGVNAKDTVVIDGANYIDNESKIKIIE